MSSKEIAARLGISPRTIDVHRAHIMDKAKVHSIADLVRLACGSAI
jgi:DNA-binding CsgD family transcriptional regulator